MSGNKPFSIYDSPLSLFLYKLTHNVLSYAKDQSTYNIVFVTVGFGVVSYLTVGLKISSSDPDPVVEQSVLSSSSLGQSSPENTSVIISSVVPWPGVVS